ncbi:recombinase family protein [Citricoccus sp. NR2]|uniref:recombinase family protein n=1 Tax=Citricoccus sp. NR2 TaxID=3004095 RepID=UPI0022DDFD2C|nr:recombinase family protein [Citricoccus sp. NR2]WBL18780.1 recombinase family protein [Citricoccus sp. NR2]
MTAIVGYARVSTSEQNPAAQVAELRAAGAVRVFTDHGESSRVRDRPQWVACQDYLRQGDTLVVRALDRLAGGEVMALQLVHELGEKGVHLRSLTEPEIDTTTPMGRALFGVVAVFVQLRVDTIRENTRRGLAHARAQGRVGGRPTVMSEQRRRAAADLQAQGHSLNEIAAALGVSRSSVWRALNRVDAFDG